MHKTLRTIPLMLVTCALPLMTPAFAQAPASLPTAAAQAPAGLLQGAPTNAAPQIHADMNQLMRGVLYPAANVVFYPQADDPAKKALPGVDPSMSTDPLTGTFGGWVAVENAALALAESANLLLIPGRNCSNGVPAPIKDPAWATFVQELRDVSMKAYKAAQAKSQDQIIELSEPLSTTCSTCHRKWRDRRTRENRCK